jgi:hypothetical protein
MHVARAQVDAGDRDGAIATLRAVQAKDPAISTVVRSRLARLLNDAGKPQDALALLGDKPEGAAAIEARGDALFALGRTEEARAAYALAMSKLDVATPQRRLVELKLIQVGGSPARPEAAADEGQAHRIRSRRRGCARRLHHRQGLVRRRQGRQEGTGAGQADRHHADRAGLEAVVGRRRQGRRPHRRAPGPAVADGHVYVAAIEGGVHAYDLQTGASQWTYEPAKEKKKAAIRLSGGPGAGGGLVVIGGLDGEVIALDAATGTEKWTSKVGAEVIAAPVIGDGLAIVHSIDGRVTAFDANTGARAGSGSAISRRSPCAATTRS